jgi:hypothetical protein
MFAKLKRVYKWLFLNQGVSRCRMVVVCQCCKWCEERTKQGGGDDQVVAVLAPTTFMC